MTMMLRSDGRPPDDRLELDDLLLSIVRLSYTLYRRNQICREAPSCQQDPPIDLGDPETVADSARATNSPSL